MKKQNKGFTLIELLAVIVVLAIILVITIPTVIGSMRNAKDKQAQNAVDSVANWIEKQYKLSQVSDNTADSFVSDLEPNTTQGITVETLKKAGININETDIVGASVKINEEGQVCIALNIPENNSKFSTGSQKVYMSPMCDSVYKPIIDKETAIDSGYVIIETESDLKAINNNPDKYQKYILMNNITLSEEWTPIGNAEILDDNFSGKINGNGCFIQNLFINQPNKNNLGLVGSSLGAQIENLDLINVNILGKSYIGGFVSSGVFNEVKNSFISGIISGTEDNVGGFIGYAGDPSIIENNAAMVSVTGNNYVGGYVGETSGAVTIKNNYTLGNVVGKGSYIGGFVGRNVFNLTIENSFSANVLTGTNHVGGLVGGNQYSSDISKINATNSYYDSTLAPNGNNGFGLGYATSELQTERTDSNLYKNWSSDIWNFKNGKYPTLK